jgi:hypothetical protein
MIIDAIDAVPFVKAHLSDDALILWLAGKTLGQYDRQLWQYTLDLYKGGDPGAFIDKFATAINNQLTRAWNEGARFVGTEPADMTDDDKLVLLGLIENEYNFVLDLGGAIEAAQELSLDDFRAQFRPRIDLWVAKYTSTVNAAKVHFGGKTRMTWTLGATEEHCDTCYYLDGKVAFAAEWEEAGLRPQGAPNELLLCGGWRCDCSLEVTDRRRTRNALSVIMGAPK